VTNQVTALLDGVEIAGSKTFTLITTAARPSLPASRISGTGSTSGRVIGKLKPFHSRSRTVRKPFHNCSSNRSRTVPTTVGQLFEQPLHKVQICVTSAWLQLLKLQYHDLLTSCAFISTCATTFRRGRREGHANHLPVRRVRERHCDQPGAARGSQLQGRNGVEKNHSTDVQSPRPLPSLTPPPPPLIPSSSSSSSFSSSFSSSSASCAFV